MHAQFHCPSISLLKYLIQNLRYAKSFLGAFTDTFLVFESKHFSNKNLYSSLITSKNVCFFTISFDADSKSGVRFFGRP